jgi:hypothetical protein
MTKLRRRNKAASAARKRSKGSAAAKLLRAMGIKGVKQARIRKNRGSVTVIPIRNRKRR